MVGYKTPELGNGETMGGLKAKLGGEPAVTAVFAELEGGSAAEF